VNDGIHMPAALLPAKKPRYPMARTQKLSGCLRKYECPLFLPGIELWFLSRKVRSPVTILVATVLLSAGTGKGDHPVT